MSPEPVMRWRDYDESPLPRVLQAALVSFAEHGFDGTSIRDIAAGAGLSVPGVYHHYASKQQILVALMEEVMGDLLTRSRAALRSAANDPAAQFDAVVECLLRFHMFRREHAFVASTELRSLEGDDRVRYVALRDEQQGLIAQAIRAGRRTGVFTTPYPDDAARAVATLCVGVASWYREDGPLRPAEIVKRYLQFAHGVVGFVQPARAARASSK